MSISKKFSLTVIFSKWNWQLTINVFLKPIFFIKIKYLLPHLNLNLTTPSLWSHYCMLLHAFSYDWFLSSLDWILNLEFCLQFFLIFYQKLLWNIRSRLNSSTFLVFEPVFRYVWSKLKLCAQKKKILIKYF